MLIADMSFEVSFSNTSLPCASILQGMSQKLPKQNDGTMPRTMARCPAFAFAPQKDVAQTLPIGQGSVPGLAVFGG